MVFAKFQARKRFYFDSFLNNILCKKWKELVLKFYHNNLFSVTPNHLLLSGHVGSVTCLLYPHDENPRYDKSYLISGGVDFTVRAWDLSSKTLLHTFNCHGGEVSRLFVTPPQCNVRIESIMTIKKNVWRNWNTQLCCS